MENNLENQIIFDININSIEDLYNILLNKGYDFVVLTPEEGKVSVIFRKDWKIIEEKFIKYQTYSEIVIKAKTISWLDVWVTTEEQEGKWDFSINSKKYNSLAKVVPTKSWEKLFLKLKEIKEEKKANSKWPQKIEIWKFVSFLFVVLIVLLIVWWAYLAFIIINAKNVDDVRFFLNLWINLNEINSFLAKIVMVFFWTLTMLLTILLIFFLTRFLITKKIFKRKKVNALILSILFFILTFSSATWWMTLDRKIKELPKWDILALWDVRIYDNSIYNSIVFDDEKSKNNRETSAFIKNTTNIIWPINIRFDISEKVRKEQVPWTKITKFTWKFWWWLSNEETLLPELPEKRFDKKWNYEVEVEMEMQDQLWIKTTKTLKSIAQIWISYVVNITEKELNNWSKQITFDASSLKNLWKIKWFSWDDWTNPISTWNTYITRWVFDETQVKMVVWDDSQDLNRIFVIWWNTKNDINWDIDFSASPLDDKEITFRVLNVKTAEWSGYIEKYKWKILWKEYTKVWEIENPEKSSEIIYKFSDYWKYEISVELTPSSWETQKLTKMVEISKNLKIKEWIKFYVENEDITDNVKHTSKTWEYFLNEFWIPSKINFDARYVKSDNIIYSLDEVLWDYNSDWNIDEKNKKWSLQINKEWRNKISVTFKFKNIKIEEEVEIKEIIYIEAIKKEHDINFKINKNSEYAPVIIWFDASKSYVKDENITKFIWNYWDWVTEEGDAVVKWHRYLNDWEYEIWLTIVTENWKKFSTSKKLIIKPKAQKIKIKSSMLEAPINQWIDFDSSESIWDIVSYLWDFGDGEISTEANPSHKYNEAWTYKVKLTWEFRNKNIMEDNIEITITN